MDEMLEIRGIEEFDLPELADAFASWQKPLKLFAKYLEMHTTGERYTIVARFDKNMIGYCTILWKSYYVKFLRGKIPEIVDLNVIEPYQGRGIAKEIIKFAEKVMRQMDFMTAGISCLPSIEYSSPQQIYMRAGYEPDGFGITDYDGEIHLIKKLSS